MKSDVSDYLELLQAVYIDACNKCSAEVSDLRDLQTIRSRVESEGLSFLTITLPEFCKSFERSLALGAIDSTLFRSFRKSGSIPAFLQGMTSQLFDRETGRILDETPDSPVLVEAVRQICLLFKKLELPCSLHRASAAIENFIRVEQANKDFTLPAELLDLFSSTSDVLWHNMLGDLRLDMLRPRHGPGATAERISGNQKYVWSRWHERLEPFFPFLGSAYSVYADESEEFQAVTFVPADQEQPVRVTLVPKTLKAPRIIAIEPVCMQYAQQSIQSTLYERIESYVLTRGHVNFRDQRVNQRLALDSSKTGRFVTIDLSDASDRVLRSLALKMFDSNPELRDAIDACRSTSAELPDGDVIPELYKFASMGSALCFPVESMYFYTICVAARLKKHNLPVTWSNVLDVTRGIYVYGDDIIVPTDDADIVLDYLQKYNCKVNDAKTFVTGKFRESCGADAYAGKLVTPTYLRKTRPENKQQASELISWIATANLFYLRGYWHTANLMYCTCEKILGNLPYVSMDSSALGRISYLGLRSADGWDDGLQTLRLRAWTPRVVYRSDEVDGYPALQKCLLSLERRNGRTSGSEEVDISSWLSLAKGHINPLTTDDGHLERSALRGAVTLKLRWVPVT